MGRNQNGAKNSKGHWDRLWRRRKQPYVYQNVVEAAEGFLGGLKDKSILEVGCGRGGTLLELARRGANAVGLDYSEEALEVCRAHQGQDGITGRATFVNGDARKLPFQAESFDFVISVGLIEHFEEPGEILAEQNRVLRAGGHLLVQVPQAYSLYTPMKKVMIRLGRWPYGGWETQFSERQLSDLAAKVGFEPQLCYGYGSLTLALVRHLIAPTLDYGRMWRVGLNSSWLRAVKARTAMDVCLVAKKTALIGEAAKVEADGSVLETLP